MYAREVKGKKLSFAVSGMLWNRSLVMIDKETESLWSHLLGESMRGELKGTMLETLPGTIMTWKAWKKAYPKTTVLALDRTAREFVKEFQEKPGRFVLGLRSIKSATAYPFEVLQEERVVNDAFEDEPVVVLFDRESTGGRAFSRRLEGKTLTFVWTKGAVVDEETGSVWTLHGSCEKGVYNGKRLTEIPAIPSFTKAWSQFYPKSTVYSGAR